MNEITTHAATFDIVAASNFAGMPVPKRQWHVEGLIPANTVTMLSGDGGVGKSLMALQLGAATVLAGYWAGRAVKGGSCLYLAAEDDLDEIHRRLSDIIALEGVGFPDLERLSIAPLVGKDAAMAVADPKSGLLRRTPVFKTLQAALSIERRDLVILDTLADLFSGNENDRAQARQFVGILKGLCGQFGCTIILLSHPSLTGMATGSGLSGSTAWNNSVRSRLYFDRVKGDKDDEPDPDLRRLSTLKANYGSLGESISLRWQDGCFVPASSSTGTLEAMAADSRADRVFLSLLAAFQGEGRNVSHTPGHNYAPVVFAKSGRAEGHRKGAFEKAMERLFADGRIKVESYGPPSKRYSRIVAA